MEIPETLVDLQRAADGEHARLSGLDDDAYKEQWRRWYEAAVRVQGAVTDHAAAAGALRCDVEAAVKKAARHPA